MRPARLATLVLLTATLGACAAKAQVRTEVELPSLDPPPPPPRVVTVYRDEPEPAPPTPAVEVAVPARSPARPGRAEAKPEPPVSSEAAPEAAKPPPPSLTLTPSPGTEMQTAAAIRELMARATRDLARLNPASLNADGRGQADAARRFLQQAEDALKARNIVYAGKLADKAATIAAVLVR
ncbi:MAG: hypothetical protein Q8O42_05420 [Acidobacteriota bacterium]|nr:hypothetical protein [Acidobacteriota bacterium]